MCERPLTASLPSWWTRTLAIGSCVLASGEGASGTGNNQQRQQPSDLSSSSSGTVTSLRVGLESSSCLQGDNSD